MLRSLVKGTEQRSFSKAVYAFGGSRDGSNRSGEKALGALCNICGPSRILPGSTTGQE